MAQKIRKLEIRKEKLGHGIEMPLLIDCPFNNPLAPRLWQPGTGLAFIFMNPNI
jgi:hypothetical protein